MQQLMDGGDGGAGIVAVENQFAIANARAEIVAFANGRQQDNQAGRGLQGRKGVEQSRLRGEDRFSRTHALRNDARSKERPLDSVNQLRGSRRAPALHPGDPSAPLVPARSGDGA